MFLLSNWDLFECAAGVLTGSGAGHGEEDHGGKEWGKSAAAIRQRHKDGRPVPNRDRQEIRQAGRWGHLHYQRAINHD